MNSAIPLRASLDLGFVPAHCKFVGGLVPEEGKLPRTDDGGLLCVQAVKDVIARSRVAVNAVQIPIFAGTEDAEWDCMIAELRELGLKVYLVMMLGYANPIEPEDEEKVLEQLRPMLAAAIRNQVNHVASTSIEGWMTPGARRRDGEEFEQAIAQNVRLHLRAYREAGVEGSCIEHWHVEFLRPGEFETFTDLGRLWQFVQAANRELGKPFFRCLVDAAHCGDSALSIPENQALIAEIAEADALGIIHASAPTTRGCLSSDEGWVPALIAAAAHSGKLSMVFIEMFHHQDAALAALRELDPRHGVDTLDGRDYAQVVADGLESIARRVNSHVARGHLPLA